MAFYMPYSPSAYVLTIIASIDIIYSHMLVNNIKNNTVATRVSAGSAYRASAWQKRRILLLNCAFP